jgi:hypothetical protein
LDPPLPKGVTDDTSFNLFDGDWAVIDPENAGGFARGRAYPSGKLGKVIGLVKNFDSLSPAITIDQIVPVWDDIPQGASRVTKRDTTIHAAGSLRLNQVILRFAVDLEPVVNPLFNRAPGGVFAFDF